MMCSPLAACGSCRLSSNPSSVISFSYFLWDRNITFNILCKALKSFAHSTILPWSIIGCFSYVFGTFWTNNLATFQRKFVTASFSSYSTSICICIFSTSAITASLSLCISITTIIVIDFNEVIQLAESLSSASSHWFLLSMHPLPFRLLPLFSLMNIKLSCALSHFSSIAQFNSNSLDTILSILIFHLLH